MPIHSELQKVDRRQSPRLRCGGQANLIELPSEGIAVPGRVLNLSEGGCSIATVLPLRPGTRAEIVLRVSAASIRVLGEVQAQRQPDVIGVEFLALSSCGRKLLVELLEELAGKHAVVSRSNASRRSPYSTRAALARRPILIPIGGDAAAIGTAPSPEWVEHTNGAAGNIFTLNNSQPNRAIIGIAPGGRGPVLDGDELDIFI